MHRHTSRAIRRHFDLAIENEARRPDGQQKKQRSGKHSFPV